MPKTAPAQTRLVMSQREESSEDGSPMGRDGAMALERTEGGRGAT
jgi:hypothetical protein